MDKCFDASNDMANYLFFNKLFAYKSGLALSNRCGLPIIPTDLFPRELSQITKIRYSKIKITFDVICLATTGILTLFFLGHLDGLGIGTILAAFTMGKAVGMIGEWMDKRYKFVSFMTAD